MKIQYINNLKEATGLGPLPSFHDMLIYKLRSLPMGALDKDGVIPIEELEVVTPAEVLVQDVELYDPYINNTAILDERDASIIDALKAYVEGSDVTVTYYHQITSNASTTSLTTTPSFISDSVNTSFLKIEKMQFKFESGITYNFQDEDSTSSISGVLITYPGFTPKIGDLFLYQISPGKVGLFKIAKNPTRLTVHNKTSYKAEFHLFKMLTTVDYTALEERVREIGYFDKQRFLTEDGALITKQEAIDLEYIKDSTDKILSRYFQKFYNKNYHTFMLANDVYDPYVVNFYREVNGFYLEGNYIDLPTSVDTLNNWESSVYATILGNNPDPSTIINTCTKNIVQYSAYSTLINMLHGKQLVVLDQDGLETHVTSSIISINPASVSNFDKLVTLFIEQSKLSTTMLRTEIEDCLAYTNEEAFYRLPILIFFCKLISNAIHYGQKTSIVDRDIEPYINVPFNNSDVVDGILTVETVMTDVIAIITNTDELINISDSLITNTEIEIIVDLIAIMSAMEITEIPGTWYLVVRNLFD